MNKVTKQIMCVVSYVLAVLAGISITGSKSNFVQDSKLTEILKNELGTKFDSKAIEEIYLAGPNKTVSCN